MAHHHRQKSTSPKQSIIEEPSIGKRLLKIADIDVDVGRIVHKHKDVETTTEDRNPYSSNDRNRKRYSLFY